MKVRLNLARLTAVAIILVIHGSLLAQEISLRGRVLDQTAAVISGAKVTARSSTLPSVSTAMTSPTGEFSLSLPPGTWSVTVEANGFEPTTEEVNVAAPVERSFTLRIAGVHDEVSITAPRGYTIVGTRTATKTPTALRDVPQAITVITGELFKDQLMSSVGDAMRVVPGVTMHQGENNRDQIIVRGNSSSADFFVNGVRDDAQYFRDLYNLDRIEALKGPNAMIFGRGGAGGVVNRVTKEAALHPIREVTLRAGAYGNKRLTADVGHPLNDRVLVRLNGMFEDSGSFRDQVTLSRYAITPTATMLLTPNTRLKVDYEFLHDSRVADRGIPSFEGRPVDGDISTYFGDPANSHVRSTVNLGSAVFEHQAGLMTVRNQTQFGDYDRFYQNFVPGAVTASKGQVALSSYNNATVRRNVFNQTDVTATLSTGRIRHTVLGGFEFGRQLTDNFRNTGYFNGATTTIAVPFDNPTIGVPVTFRQNATDADNHLHVGLGAGYAQDQIALNSLVQVVVGARLDRFDLTYHNNRNGDTLQRIDNLVSPRVGVVFKPASGVSLYGTHSVSYLPSSGDQFSSLTSVTQQMKPEKFFNYESGLKWDVTPTLSVTSAVYRLNRVNTRATDPNDPTRIVQTGSHRTNGFEASISGRPTARWETVAGYNYQDAYVSAATSTAHAGAIVGQVPHHTVSLWSTYRVEPRLRFGIGLVGRTDMFVAIDNTVTLPGYVRADAAVYYSVNRNIRIQANAENVFNRRYFANADNNTNISPGYPRAVRLGLTTIF